MGAILAHKREEGSSKDSFAVINYSSKYLEHFLSEKFFFNRKNSRNTKYVGAGFPSRGSEALNTRTTFLTSNQG